MNDDFKERTIRNLIIESGILQERIDKAIELLERYNDKENNYYVPVMETIDILKGKDDND